MKLNPFTLCLACLLFIGCASNPQQAVDSWYNFPEQGMSEEHAVPRQCIMQISPQNLNVAISMLETEPIVPVSIQQAKELLAVDILNPDALLEQIAQTRDAQAVETEKESNMPELASDTAEEMKQWAADHRKTAAYLRSLKGQIKPYLCRALVMNEGPASSFHARYNDTELSVIHLSLDTEPVQMKRRPVIILLPKKAETVYVFAVIGQPCR